MPLYYGCVTLQKGRDMWNENGYGLCPSKYDFIGRLMELAKSKHPDYHVVNSWVSEIPEATIKQAAAELGPCA